MKAIFWVLIFFAAFYGTAARGDDSAAKAKTAVESATENTTSDDASGNPTTDGDQNSGDGFFASWFRMVARTQSEQPHWVTPVATTTPRLEQEYRYDMWWQTQSNGTTRLANYGGSKGLEIIPAGRFEVIASPPPYIVRSVNGVPDGYGDLSFLLKYRIFAGSEEHGNYIFTAFLGASVPTGQYTNGAKSALITPTLAGGKGWGNFDVVSTLGAALPTDETAVIGRQVLWNTAFQYRIMKKIWPEAEINSTFFVGGPNDGKKQTFITPGLVLGRFPIYKRLAVTVGGGLQTATTRFHTYNHRWILTVRFPF
jgi:hypothetical protein